MKKRILSLLLCLVLLCALLSVTAFAADEDYTFDDLTGALTVNTAAGVTAWEVVVDPTAVKSVTVASAVTEIPSTAFQGLSNLEAVEFQGAIEIKDGVYDTGTHTVIAPFAYTPKLASITFSGAAKLGDFAFAPVSSQPNTALKKLVFPEGSTFGKYIFQYFDALEEVTFEGDVEFNEANASNFAHCPELKKVTFEGKCIMADYSYAFENDPKIAEINFGGAAKLGNKAFYVYSTDHNTALKKLVFPEGSTFGMYVFEAYDALEEVTFEGDAEFNGSNAEQFAHCPELKKVTFEGKCTIADNSYAFGDDPKIAEISFGGAAKLGNRAFYNYDTNPNAVLKSITFPDGSSVGDNVFYSYDALQSIVFEGSFDLKEHAFTTYDIYNDEYHVLPALNAIYFTSVTPPTMKNSAFGGIDPDKTTIYVPCICNVEDYKNELAKDTGTDPDVTYNSEFVDKVKVYHDWVKTDSSSHTCTVCSETEDHNFSGRTCVDCGYTKPTTTYTLTFNVNGGSAISSVSGTYGKVIDLDKYVPTMDGFRFGGWYSDSPLTSPVDEIKLTGNKTVYAKWIAFPFTDVAATAWSYDDIYYVWEKGLMQGVSETEFAPQTDTSRAMIVTILWRLEGEPVVNYAMSFDDVADGQWYTEAIRWAQANNIVNGYSAEKFDPDAPITREQMAAILYRYAQTKGEGFTGSWMFLLDFTDAGDISDWANEAMHWCVMKNLVRGVGNDLLGPQGLATREQVAAILHRFCEVIEK